MSLNERLEFLVNVNAEGAIKGFKAVGAEAEKNLTKAQGGIDKTGQTMSKVGAGMVVGAGLIGTGLFELSKKWEESALSAGKLSAATGLTVDQASRWQVVAKGADVDTATLTTSLGKMDKAIEKTPEKFAELGATIVRNKDGTVDASTTFLNVVDALNKAGGAANNANTATAILGKGWQGMSEILKQSSGELKTSLESVNKAQIFNEDDVKQAEAFRATMKELGNTVQSLALSLGKSALPVVEDVTKALTVMAKGFSAVNDATGGVIGKFAAMGALGLGMIGTLSAIGGQAIKMRGRFTELGDDGERSLNKLGTAAKGVGIGLGVAAVAMAAYTLQQNLNAANNKNFTSSLDAVTKATDDQAVAITENLIKAWKWADDAKPEELAKRIATENLAAAIKVRDLAAANTDYAAGLAKTGVTTDMLTKAIDAQVASQKKSAEATQKAADAADTLTTATDASAASMVNSQNTAAGYSYAEQSAADTTKRLADQTAEAKRQSDDFAASIKNQTDKLNELYPKAYDAVQAKYQFQQATTDADAAVAAMNETLKKHKATTDDGKAAIDAALGSVKQAAVDYATMDGAAVGSEGAIRRQIKSLQDQEASLAPNSPLRKYIDEYVAALAAIPSTVATTFNLHISSGSVTTSAGDVIGVRVGAHAQGTTNAEDAFIAGEDGPELVTGRKGATVLTNKKTRQLLGGRGGVTVHNHFNGITDVAEITRQSSRALRWELIKG